MIGLAGSALGARAGTVMRGVLGQGLGLTIVGVVLGGAASYWATRLLQSELFEIKSHDPVALAVAPVVLIAAATLACVVPVLRALKVDPANALRE